MDKIYANIDKIVRINIFYEELLDYTFKEEEPPITKKFLGLFEINVIEYEPPRWVDKYGSYVSDSYYSSKPKLYRIQDFPKMLFKKPHIELVFGNDVNNIIKYFDTNDDLDKFVMSIRTKSNNILSLIKEK